MSEQTTTSDSLCADPARKVWVIEMHGPNGEPASHPFAVLTLNQDFVNNISEQARLLKAAMDMQNRHQTAGHMLDMLECTVSFAASESEGRFLAEHHFWQLTISPSEKEVVLMWMSPNDGGTTGIYVNDLVAQFATQPPEDVLVFARPGEYANLADAIAYASERIGKWVLENKKILAKAVALCDFYAEHEPEPYKPAASHPQEVRPS